MRVPKVLIGLFALATLATITVAGSPAQADDRPTVVEIDDRGEDIEVAEIRSAVERATGEWLGAPDRAVVVTDPGADLTPEEIETLLAGKDAGEVRLLRTVDELDVGATLKDLTDGVDTAARKVVIGIGRIRVTVTITCRLWPPKCTIKIVISRA